MSDRIRVISASFSPTGKAIESCGTYLGPAQRYLQATLEPRMGISPKDKRDMGNDLSDDPSTLTERERGPIGHVRGDETARDGVEEIGRWGAFPSVSSGT